jgi:anti-sigma B factor antagonist
VEGPDRWGEPLSPSELFAAESFGSRCAKRDGVIWLSLGGELDVFTAPKLREALDQAMPGSGETLVLDLRGLSFLDSSGLAVILGAHERISGSDDGELHIVIAGSAPVEALFETIGAADYLPLLDDPQAFTSVSGA